MKKKILIISISTLLLGISVIGCSTPTSSSTTSNNNNQSTTSNPPVVEPVFDLNDEWKNHLNSKLEELPEGKSFVFITDTHWDGNKKKSTELLKYIDYKLGGDTKIIFGGDAYGSDTTSTGALNQLNEYYTDQLYNNFGSNALFVRGNHDNNDLGPAGEQILDSEMYLNTVAKIEDAVIDLDEAKAFGECAKEYFTTNPKEGLDVTLAQEQAEAFMKLHYYVDDETDKIRHIVLDSAGKTWTQRNLFGTSHMYNGALVTQLEWLKRTLNSTPLDYDVVVSCHSIGHENEGENLYSSYSRNIYEMLSMFKNHEKGKTRYAWFGGDSPMLLKYFNTKSDGYPIEVDFTNRTSSKSTVITLAGHWHHDKGFYVGKNGSTYTSELAEYDELSSASSLTNATLTIRTGCDAKGNQSSTDSMTNEGINSQRFDIITITEEEVVCTRIGYGENRYFNYH